jgi:hypothetical protein
MTLEFNAAPYYDDFSESKGFYRILFRPGRAVQARELTQLQTQIQTQIGYLGKHFFKEGALVLDGQQQIDYYYKFVKLTAADNGIIESLIGSKITGQSSGVNAIIIKAVKSENNDPPTIYVKYLDSGTSRTATGFSNSETLQVADSTTTLTVASSDATGVGTALTIRSGVIFTKNNLVYFDEQTALISKYTGGESTTLNRVAGFVVTESFVTSQDDVDLLDPALGSSNYFAPGADRYTITLTLEARDLTPATADDVNFIELLRIEDGFVVNQKINTDYNILGDTLARRTYDESGNYVVKPYGLELIEHLRTSNTSIRDGYLAASGNGNSQLFVNVITPGKAYVQGYEIENLKSRYLNATKARDFVSLNNSPVSLTVGNYVFITGMYSAPDFTTLSRVKLYKSYTASNGSASGTQVGTARIRHIEYSSGTGTSAIYKCFLFDISMNTGYVFEEDVKQLYFDNSSGEDFTANISASSVLLTGSINTTDGSTSVTGTGTRFTTELSTGDYLTVNGNTILVSSITNDVTLVAGAAVVGNLSGVAGYVQQAIVNDTTYDTYIYPFPYDTIREVDPTNIETVYTTKRYYNRTLTTGSVTITAGTDETFAAFSTQNYLIVDRTTGAIPPLYAANITIGGGGTTLAIALGSSFGSDSITVMATVDKTNSAADKKVKTLVTGATVDFTTSNTAALSTLSLGQADIYELASVSMSANAFGTAYTSSNATDITSRYILDNGQRLSHYDLGTISLKPGQPKPTGPLRVTYSYFTHSSGDYFSVSSYAGIDYKDIPSFTAGDTVYQLRDCLDFRPRVNTDGTTFVTPSEIPEPNDTLFTDFSYYLGRSDKIVLDSTGSFKYITGTSSLTPVEPKTPDNSMLMYVLKQKPYVFDLQKDIDVTVIDNKRYTMRDIGRIENRVKNLEYYTTLSLLEKDTESFQIQDSLGFDRFKNGFLVDNFEGHKIGDVANPDYKIAMDFNKREIRPKFTQKTLRLKELNTSTSQRTSNNYALTGNVITLPYTSNVIAQNSSASRRENINPFSVINFTGTIDLNPPSDIWFDTVRAPTVYKDQNENLSTLTNSNASYETIWGAWREVWYGNDRVEERTGTRYTVAESVETTATNDVVISKVVIPKMRSVVINFVGRGLKPNTKLNAYFDNYNVTQFCRGNVALSGNVFADMAINKGNLYTNYQGVVAGAFYYDSTFLQLPTGDKIFRLSDSTVNGNDSETQAEAIFKTSGELTTVQNTVISTRRSYQAAESVYDRRDLPDPVFPSLQPPELPPPPPSTPDPTIIDGIVSSVFRLPVDQNLATKWEEQGTLQTILTNTNTVAATAEKTTAASYIDSGGGIDVYAIDEDLRTGAYVPSDATLAAFNAVHQIVSDGWASGLQLHGTDQSQGLVQSWIDRGFTEDAAIRAASIEVTAALIARDLIPDGAGYKDFVLSIVNNPDAATDNIAATAAPAISEGRICYGTDPLAQTFAIGGSPVYLSKVDLYFYSKDEVLPMFVEIRPLVAGIPSQTVVPFSRVVVQPSQISTSDDGQTATTVYFDGLVYLEPGQYAIVLLTSSINYSVWISQIGETDVYTNRVISEQPFVGVLYKSQNAVSWTPDQLQDLKFKLYNAEFTSTSGTVDLVVNPAEYTNKKLSSDPLEVYPNQTTMKVLHDSHGLTNGSYVVLNGFDLDGMRANVSIGNIFGINVATVGGVQFAVSNVKPNSYTINLPSTPSVTSVTRGGGAGIFATQDVKYDTIYPVISTLTPAGTDITYKLKGTSVGYTVDSSFITLSKDDNELSTTKILAGNTNISASMSGARPLTLRLEMASDNSTLSPVIDIQSLGAVFVTNIVNSPTYANENLSTDIITIAKANNIFFTNISNTSGYISIQSAVDKANAALITKGTTVTVSNSSVNSGSYRVLDILDDGANIKVSGLLTNAAAANVITITNGIAYVAEEAVTGGSALAKYITKQVDFVNPSTSINLRIDVAKPSDGDVKIYYKLKLPSETSIKDKEYTELTGLTIPASLGGEYYEVEKQIDNLNPFTGIVLKIVLLSTNSAKPPKCKNLRLVALA